MFDNERVKLILAKKKERTEGIQSLMSAFFKQRSMKNDNEFRENRPVEK